MDDLKDSGSHDAWVYDSSKNECDWTLYRYKYIPIAAELIMDNWTDTLVDIAGLRAYVI